MSERELAKAHWKYTKKIIDKMLELVEIAYVEAMVHGLKHNDQSSNKKVKE